MLLPGRAIAAGEGTLSLGGYRRPGQNMAVRVMARGGRHFAGGCGGGGLPLGGYWRPGKYMPVRVMAREAGNSLEIGGDGVVPVRLRLREGRFDGVVPLLVISEPRGIGDRPMRQVRPEQRLVGFTTIDIPFAQELFAGDTIVPIQLSAAD